MALLDNSPDGAAIIDLSVDRYDDFQMPVTFQNDLTGAAFAAEIRLAPGATGDPLATMTISAPIVADGETTFTMSLAAATIETDLPEPAEPEEDAVFYWSMVMTLATKRRTLFRGTFTVTAGVTQP